MKRRNEWTIEDSIISQARAILGLIDRNDHDAAVELWSDFENKLSDEVISQLSDEAFELIRQLATFVQEYPDTERGDLIQALFMAEAASHSNRCQAPRERRS